MMNVPRQDTTTQKRTEMKKILLTILSLLTLTLGMAQSDNQSRTILDKTHSTFKASEGIHLSFTLTSLDQNDQPYDVQPGEAFIKGNQFRLEMDAMTVWFNGTTQWVLIKEVNEVNISNPTPQEVASISPLALLSMYKTGYTFKAPTTVAVNGENAHRVEMTPTEKNSDFTSVSVAIDKASHTLLQVHLTFTNGAKNQIDITKYNANYHYPDAEFTFDPSAHPGVEIVDLR